jgi:L-amino acid N-acyltransferase YncA
MTTIRRAGDDADAIRSIYAPIVRETAISFEEDPPTTTEMQRRIEDTSDRYPWLVCESAGDVLGFVKAGPHKSRAAYRWAVDVSVYVHKDARHCGVGRGLYESLLEILTVQGYCTAIAVIALPNPVSVGLHESLGFERVGILHDVGYKHGAWYDVGWWQRPLGERPGEPTPIRQVSKIEGSPDWETACSNGIAVIDL